MTVESVALNQKDPVKPEEVEEQLGEIKLYKIRWLIITIFVLYAAVSSLQWVQYSIIANIIVKYYGVSFVAVDWTSMISMITYPPLLLPASYMLDRVGLRYCALIGVSGTAIGTWIKMFSAQPHLFYLGFIGQTTVFVSQLFILSLPPKVASVWFGPNEVSTACSLGVFGTQLGTALSFMVSPLVVRNHDNIEDIGRDLSYLFYGGLRYCALIGVSGTAIGTWIKMFSAQPHLFYLGFIGQTTVFVSQLFILSLPPKVASVWFGPNEVSTACSLGVFGTQLGTALSFMVSPLVVRNHDNIEDIGRDLSYLFYGVGAVITPVVILVFIFFKAEPPLPPSVAQAKLRLNKSQFTNTEFLNSYKSLLTNKPFLVLTFAYGINIGVFASVGTMLNQIISSYFVNAEKDAGTIGLLQVVIGCLGIVFFGIILDKTKRYKEVNILLYVMTISGIGAFMAALETHNIVLVYITGCCLGFFQNAYYAAGLEFGVELSFPQPESSSSGILISMSQIFGVIYTLLFGKIIATLGTFWALGMMVVSLGIGTIITVFIPNILLRQEALQLSGEDKAFLPKNKNRKH
ncbi:Major Facilitator Superfamily [Popillia japonica]|uniref:Major Facilitator Superfamily n=1 Tax=Popillia japonica TaxID=7064 RepID=A0AAW1ISL7_POPJA